MGTEKFCLTLAGASADKLSGQRGMRGAKTFAVARPDRKGTTQMPFMAWNDKLSVGIEEIDADHKELVGLINKLYDEIRTGHGKDDLESILDRLVDYTQYHFEHERELFAMTAYTDTEAHETEHAKMVAWVLKAQAEFTASTLPAPSLEVMTNLKDWLFEHILVTDQKYVPYVKVMTVS
jgi:hemerythrin-like metal-binding protein